MKKAIICCFIIFLLWFTTGIILLQTTNPYAHKVLGSCTCFLAFILMPLFISYRYKDGNYKKYQINDNMFIPKKDEGVKVLDSINDFPSKQESYVTVGTFDGVHIGHRKIIKNLVSQAQKAGKKSVLLTFFPHPRMILKQDNEIKLIQTITERATELRKLGLDYIIIHTFDKKFARTDAMTFISEIFVEKLNISKIIIGYNHHFGKNREGNITQLHKYSVEYNYEVEEISAQDINEVSVSSTKIRKAISEGNIQLANTYLDTNFTLNGQVTKGKQLGTKIGFPTANITISEDYKLIPKTGVYIVKSFLEKKEVYGMMNIGKCPTVNGHKQTIEVHFLDLNKNLYNKHLTIELLDFIREEQKFDNLKNLIAQLKKDEIVTRNFQLKSQASIVD